MNVLIGTLLVYSIGIGVPAIFRYVILKRTLEPHVAKISLVFWWFTLYFIISLLKDGERPSILPLLIVVWISYYILTRYKWR